MFPSTVERVPRQTAQRINDQILHETETRVARTSAGGRQAIDRRLAELA